MNLEELIDDMEDAARSTPRDVRIEGIEAVIDAYIEQTGYVPDNQSLYRMTNVILSDELTDKRSNKGDAFEYPFLSRNQLLRRKVGVHQGRNVDGSINREVPLRHAANLGADGQDYSLPIRTY